MKFKNFLLLTLLATTLLSANAQVTDAEKQLRTDNTDTLFGWKRGGVINIGLSQTSLTNWAAGGQNSVATNGILSLYAKKKMQQSFWDTYLDMGYGVLKQGIAGKWWKTDDRIDFTTNYGKKATEKWYYSALVNLKTQMAPGFNYPNDSVKISNLFAPGYALAAIGMEYKYKEIFSAFIAPFTDKTTIVADQSLADAGAFGVKKAQFDASGNMTVRGQNIRNEFGGYVRLMFKKDIMKNVMWQSSANFFSNYLHNPQNIDIYWDNLISLKVNKFISATISTSLIYDDDIIIVVRDSKGKPTGSSGPRLQFKEILNIGFSYKF